MRLIPLALTAACLGGCALTGGDRLPVCDGKDRRPANPNGSVLLPTADQPQASASAASGPIPASSLIGSCR